MLFDRLWITHVSRIAPDALQDKKICCDLQVTACLYYKSEQDLVEQSVRLADKVWFEMDVRNTRKLGRTDI